jgi:hypothetical protein
VAYAGIQGYAGFEGPGYWCWYNQLAFKILRRACEVPCLTIYAEEIRVM